MNLLETDHFEERIQAVENRAGRIAWRVMIGVQTLILMLLLGFVEDYREYMFDVFSIGIIGSFIAYGIVKRKAGISKLDIHAERRRLGQTPEAKRIIRKNVTNSIVYGIIALAFSYPAFTRHFDTIYPWLAFAALFVIITHRVYVYGYLGSRSQRKQAAAREEE